MKDKDTTPPIKGLAPSTAPATWPKVENNVRPILTCTILSTALKAIADQPSCAYLACTIAVLAKATSTVKIVVSNPQAYCLEKLIPPL